MSLLNHRHQPDINHGDQRQRDDEPGPFARGIRCNRHRKTQETVGAELQHDGCQHGRAPGRRLDVYIWQPGVHRPHRNLDGKCRKEREEKQRLRSTRQRQLVPRCQIETAARLGVQEDQGHQHQQRAQQGVEEELERRVDLVWPAPNADDQVHRNEGRLKENVKQHAIERAENADHQAAENQEGAHVLVDPARNDLPARDHNDDVDECGQQDEPQRNAVHPEVVVHIEPLDPDAFLDELHGGRIELEPAVER